jgi:hypothetical protein
MEDCVLSLSAHGMTNIPSTENDETFTFVVDGARHSCRSIAASFISPVVARIRSIDPSSTEFFIDTPDPDHEFSSFLSLACGTTIKVTQGAHPFFRSIARELGNQEICHRLAGHFDSLTSTVESVAQGEVLECSISGMASRFWALSHKQLSQIPLEILCHILGHESLQLSSEDSLCDFISSNLSGNPSYSALFRFVRFENLSPDCIGRFLSFISDGFGGIDNQIWSALSSRFVLSANCDTIAPSSQFYRHFDPTWSWTGIIGFLTDKSGANGTLVSLEHSGTFMDDFQSSLNSAADLDTSHTFWSENAPDQWLSWDFHELRVDPTHYTLWTQDKSTAFCCCPGSWRLEGSVDGSNWTEIDRQTHNTDYAAHHTFEVSRNGPFRFIRFTQAGTNYYGSHVLVIEGFELFGDLFTDDQSMIE